MSRPTNPPEDASGMRCLGCGYYDDEPQAQRMCEVGEGAGHAFVRVGPDGCVPAPDDDPAEVHIPPRHGKSALTGMFGDPDSWDALHNDVDGAAVSVPDDPATLRARLQERYERPERPCTYDPADEEPEAEPVSRVDIEHRWTNPEAPPLTLRMEYEQADWTPPRPEPVEYAVAPQDGPDPRNDVRGLSKKTWDPTWMDDMPVFRLGTKDNPGGFMTYGEMRKQNDATLPPGTVRAALERDAPVTYTNTVGGSFPCLCGAVLHWSGPHNGARGLNEDGTPHTCPTVERPITDTTDPEWVRQIHGAPPGQPVRLLAAGSADDYTAEMAEHRATIYRALGYTDVSVSVFRPEPQPPREECPACGEYGWHDSRCDLDSYHLRSYLRTLTNPDATPEDVNAALDNLTPEDRALVSEALPSWGSARMSRVEAIAPFMARFERLVRDRDPRAHEEGTLLLSALREDDPTRSTVEALMEIAKTPKVNP